MNKRNTEYLVAKAKEHTDPFSKAVLASVEVGVVVPSKLRSKLKEAGFTINEDEDEHAKLGYRKFEHLTRVLVHPPGSPDDVVAMGAAGDVDQALLAAALGYAREYEDSIKHLAGHDSPQEAVPVPGRHNPTIHAAAKAALATAKGG